MPRLDRAASLAAAMLRFRRSRPDSLPAELFGEPAWDLLLQLFVADAEGRLLTGRDAALAAHVPLTVMSRWLKHLSAIGLIVGDGSGDIGDELTLSASALDHVERLLSQAQALKEMMD